MKQNKYLFIDRDGTLINEPLDKQIDAIEKLEFLPGVMSALLALRDAGYIFVMVSNQDGLGTASLPQADFDAPHALMLRIFASQGIVFENVRICPHRATDLCDCRKPKVGLLLDYLAEQKIERANSWVIGDRDTDLELAKNMGIAGIKIGAAATPSWPEIAKQILTQARTACVVRKTKETEISVQVNLDATAPIQVSTGLGFFDHMLEQLAKHAGFALTLQVQGDLQIDDHHSVEDTGISLGEALRQALGDKRGIHRYGFLLPMDEALAQIAIDLSGRSYFEFDGRFEREKVGELSTELVPHFFRSLAEGLKATLHIRVQGENTHHMVEAIFKGVGRALGQAIAKTGNELPSTKGIL